MILFKYIKLFTLSLFVVGVFVISNNTAVAVECLPPNCNIPDTITEEGGVILSGSQLILQGEGVEVEHAIIGNGLFRVTSDITSGYSSPQSLTVVEYVDGCVGSRYSGVDNCWLTTTYPPNSSEFKPSFFKKRMYADDGISVAPEMNISLAGPNSFEIKNTLNSWYGSGFHAFSKAPNTTVGTSDPEFRNFNPAVWGQGYAYASSGSMWLTYAQNGDFDSMDINFGILGQADGKRSIGIYSKATEGAIAAHFSGGLFADTMITNDLQIMGEEWYTSYQNYFDNFGLRVRAQGYNSSKMYYPLVVSSNAPNKVFFGGTVPNNVDAGTIEICLNDDGSHSSCISEIGEVLDLKAVSKIGAVTTNRVTAAGLCITDVCVTASEWKQIKELLDFSQSSAH